MVFGLHALIRLKKRKSLFLTMPVIVKLIKNDLIAIILYNTLFHTSLFYLKETSLSLECPEKYTIDDLICHFEERGFRYSAQLSMTEEELKNIIQEFKNIPRQGDIFTLGITAIKEPAKIDKRREIMTKLVNNIVAIQVYQKINGAWENVHEEHFEPAPTGGCVLL
ncbi:hypothetical protein Lbir_1712 [Legionella birminghamensis]|uniref:Uncharacterized protein n=1 Tax=Legionella birminghamensis TaxID=28083 RepID=A0A378I7L5_9GAMM|nr:hypothetical protein [Legionella birminghamensis]KTC71560.1 hypothetical protein Lbir_1712 [Legionella birminghamensis]STX30832.1 Uncharacterised protein [Legionella birminghamensis]